MSDSQFHLNKALQELEEINQWFQEEDIDLEEGLQRLKQGKELIAQCRERLQNVENEFLKIKAEFAQDEEQSETIKLEDNDKDEVENGEREASDDIPF